MRRTTERYCDADGGLDAEARRAFWALALDDLGSPASDDQSNYVLKEEGEGKKNGYFHLKRNDCAVCWFFLPAEEK